VAVDKSRASKFAVDFDLLEKKLFQDSVVGIIRQTNRHATSILYTTTSSANINACSLGDLDVTAMGIVHCCTLSDAIRHHYASVFRYPR
jgi:hypothetical protein